MAINKIKILFLLTIIIGSVFLMPKRTSAVNIITEEFGLTPANINVEYLLPGSIYKTTLFISRGNSAKPLVVEKEINVPGANDWITINNNKPIVFEIGEEKKSVPVYINIPTNIDVNRYSGKILLTTKDNDKITQLGLSANVDLNIVLKKVRKIKINSVTVLKAENSDSIGSFLVPGRVKLLYNATSIGNSKTSPTKIKIKVYDSTRKKLLSESSKQFLSKIDPFTTRNSEVDIYTQLPSKEHFIIVEFFSSEKQSPLFIQQLYINAKSSNYDLADKIYLILLVNYKSLLQIIALLLILHLLVNKRKKRLKHFYKKQIN